jgi:hypothetical protein
LSSSNRAQIITAFSGMNDSQLLLPAHIRRYDLPELQKTNTIVVNTSLPAENESYQSVFVNTSLEEILDQIVKLNIDVILDVGP